MLINYPGLIKLNGLEMETGGKQCVVQCDLTSRIGRERERNVLKQKMCPKYPEIKLESALQRSEDKIENMSSQGL